MARTCWIDTEENGPKDFDDETLESVTECRIKDETAIEMGPPHDFETELPASSVDRRSTSVAEQIQIRPEEPV